MAYNTSLNAARSVKNDEFYTRYEDIEREMEAYLAYNPRLFHGKTVLLPCDDYKRSNFVRYFSQNFSRFGLAGLAATSYQADGRGQCSIIGKGFPIYGDAGQGIRSSSSRSMGKRHRSGISHGSRMWTTRSATACSNCRRWRTTFSKMRVCGRSWRNLTVRSVIRGM